MSEVASWSVGAVTKAVMKVQCQAHVINNELYAGIFIYFLPLYVVVDVVFPYLFNLVLYCFLC